MSNKQKLEFGIEIVAAMKASCYDFDMEHGRYMALEDTEIDRMEGLDRETFESYPEERKEQLKHIASIERSRLHKQALFVAEVAINKYLSLK